MVAFVEVLDKVEQRSREAEGAFRAFYIGLAEPCVSQCAERPMATAQAVAAYHSNRGDTAAPPLSEQAAPDHEIDLHAPPQRLKRLRRELAWRLHPDRDPARGSSPMAEVNAAIDAALMQSSSRPNRR